MVLWGQPSQISDVLRYATSEFISGRDAPLIDDELPTNTCFILPASRISSLLSDIPSATLLMSLYEAQDGLSTILFHPVQDSTFADTLEKFVDKSVNLQTPPMDDTAFNVFDTFAKVSRFYYTTAKTLLGGEDTRRRPRSPRDDDSGIKNPWIVDRVALSWLVLLFIVS